MATLYKKDYSYAVMRPVVKTETYTACPLVELFDLKKPASVRLVGVKRDPDHESKIERYVFPAIQNECAMRQIALEVLMLEARIYFKGTGLREANRDFFEALQRPTDLALFSPTCYCSTCDFGINSTIPFEIHRMLLDALGRENVFTGTLHPSEENMIEAHERYNQAIEYRRRKYPEQHYQGLIPGQFFFVPEIV